MIARHHSRKSLPAGCGCAIALALSLNLAGPAEGRANVEPGEDGPPAAQQASEPSLPAIVGSEPTVCTAEQEQADAAKRIPALTIVELVIDAELGSKISWSGQTFRLHLASPIVVDGREMIPAGTEGQGEVVHAKKAGMSGSPGELVLAARFLALGDRQMRLRSMRIAMSGADNINKVDAYNAAAAGAAVLSPLPLGLLGFAITGKNVVLPAGTKALAKTAAEFCVPSALQAAPADPGEELKQITEQKPSEH